jgi:spoIIIJ-associated protein
MNQYVDGKNAKTYLEHILAIAEIEGSVYEEEVDESTVCYRIECRDNDARLLIGKRGQTLEALQFLLRQMSKGEEEQHFIIDVRDYRNRRRESIVDYAKKGAVGVLNGEYEEYALAPMTAYERRLVHNYLQENFPELNSGSRGEGMDRHIVISYQGEGAPEGHHHERHVEPDYSLEEIEQDLASAEEQAE